VASERCTVSYNRIVFLTYGSGKEIKIIEGKNRCPQIFQKIEELHKKSRQHKGNMK
jgi:hypothetical protein